MLPKVIDQPRTYYFQEPQTFDFSKVEDQKRGAVHPTTSTMDDSKNVRQAVGCQSRIIDYARTGEYSVHFGAAHFVTEPRDEAYLVKNNVVHYWMEDIDYFNAQKAKEVSKVFERAPSAVVLPYDLARPKSAPGKFELSLLINADNGESDSPDQVITCFEGDDAMPEISFLCLARFYPKAKAKDAAKLLADGAVEVVDWVPAGRKDLTDAEKVKLKEWRAKTASERSKNPFTLPSPEPGYVLIDIPHDPNWHRTATVVLRDVRKGGRSILMGVDEDQYFGCELPTHPKTVDEAMEALKPEAVKKASSFQRQGEWFMIPVAEKDVPKVEECDLEFKDLILPRESPASARHIIGAKDGRIKDKLVYARDPNVAHDSGQHEHMVGKGWQVFHRNTALRSFSVAGVD